MNYVDDKIKRVYVQLASLRKNLHDDHPSNKVEWDNVNLYNGLLAKLESIGFDTDDFKIPSDMLTNERTEINYLTHETEETGSSNVRHEFFVTKLDSLLAYFQLGDKKTKFGFHDAGED